MTTRERIHQLVDQVPEEQLDFVLTLLTDREDDEPLTPEDIAALDAAEEDIRQGRVIPHAEIVREFCQ